MNTVTTPIALRGAFPAAVAAGASEGRLVVQPRMGMATPAAMAAGLRAVKAAGPHVVGTITVDSFTRTGDLAATRRALLSGSDLNGYPIATHGATVTRSMLEQVWSAGFPVQVRHGSARPGPIIEAMCEIGMDATEGGPVSYCLPYGRTPLSVSVAEWRVATQRLAGLTDQGLRPHLESFGGCMLGQLCPPSLLVALAVLEGMFFRQNGVRSVSLSLTQQTSHPQDVEALVALRQLAGELLHDVDWHIVLYGYMGLFPVTSHGARALIERSAQLATEGGAHRLIVKTVAEAQRIATVSENVDALLLAAEAAASTPRPPSGVVPHLVGSGVLKEARDLIEATTCLDDDLGRALIAAFARGVLDVPHCLHPDNAGRSRSAIAPDGSIQWVAAGGMPVTAQSHPHPLKAPSAALLDALEHTRSDYDERRFDEHPA